MDAARASLLGQVLLVLVLALALLIAIDALDFRGPDPTVPRYILDSPSEHRPGPTGCAPFC